jgi:hypothetical protein
MLAVMDAKQLTAEQRAGLFHVASKHREWLQRLLNRMRELRWDESDATFREAREAEHALRRMMRAVNESRPAETEQPKANKWKQTEHQPSLAEMGETVVDLSPRVLPGTDPWRQNRRRRR